MAKKRSSRGQRDNHLIASEAVAPVYLPSLPKSPLSDLRFYQPSRPKVAYDDLGRRARVVQQPQNRNLSRPRSAAKTRWSAKADRLQRAFRERLSFVAPSRVLVCVRRKQRREVLFAKNRTRGRGPRRRNQFSKVRC